MAPTIIITILIVFALFNALTIRQLLRVHPRRRRPIIALAIICNLMWPFLPLLNARTDFSRFIRATLGPPWFAWIVFSILYSALSFALLLIWLPMRRSPFPRFARGPSRMFIGAVIVASVVGCWQALVPLRVERVPVHIANLPAALEGTRLAVMGDLHVGLYSRPSRLSKLFATAQSLHPDAVLLAGDLVDDDPHFAPKLLEATRALPPETPLLAVLGNHEMYGDPFEVIATLRGSRIHLLLNDGVALRRGLAELWIAGISDYAAEGNRRTQPLDPNMAAALAKKPADSVAILLSHQPKSYAEAVRRHVPLTICAHTHGGQFGFRPLHWSLAGLFLPYHMGLYERNGSQLYVNTGTGYWLLPFRLGMTPEITLIELHRAQ